MIKGEYAEAIGPKGKFKKHRQLQRIAEYEKQEVPQQLRRGEGAARGGLSLFCLHTVTCDLTNKEESTHQLFVCYVANTNVSSTKTHLLGNDK